MLSYQEFEKAVEYLQRSTEFHSDLCELYCKNQDVIQDERPGIPAANSIIIQLLNKSFPNLPTHPVHKTTLEWWIYETDFGKRKDILYSFTISLLPEDHPYRHPKLDTIRDLYDFLVWESGLPEETNLKETQSSIVKTEKALSPVEYVHKVFPDRDFPYTEVNLMMSEKELRDLLDREGKEFLWDYPLSEIDEIMEYENPVVLVHFDDGKEETYRWFDLEN